MLFFKAQLSYAQKIIKPYQTKLNLTISNHQKNIKIPIIQLHTSENTHYKSPFSLQMFILKILIIIILILSLNMAFVFKPQWVNQGKGAKVIRIIGNQHLKKMDPFLMLDLFKVRLPAGFPDHPHRGFETVTYMLQGSFYHEDFKGHKGKIQPGDLQWMTAGRGIMHSEIPASFQEDSYGFQLWINLRKELKMIPPQYQEYKSNQLQIIELEKSKVKIISGQWKGKKGPILARTPTYYFDVSLQENGDFDIPIPKKWNTLVFVYQGKLNYTVNGKTRQIDEFHCCVLEQSDEDDIEHKFRASKNSKFVLIGGEPLNEPIVQHGPFVMNTKEEIYQAFDDYQKGKNGFEGSHQWQSKIQFLSQGAKFEQL